MKRGTTDCSLIVGVNKPVGMTSHDVVNRCRFVFGERRVGHTGTLDPLASGALPVCVGPATRLDAYLAGHDKRYRVRMAFGAETTTDDAEGESTIVFPIARHLRDEAFAVRVVSGLVGSHEQVPPQYSAIKVDGRCAYERARRGEQVELAPRSIEVRAAELVCVKEQGEGLFWTFEVLVSKGAYIRSLVRDLGRDLGCPAHVNALQRTRAGRVDLGECVSLETLAQVKEGAALDPVRVLGLRFAFLDGFLADAVRNGAVLPAGELELFEALDDASEANFCACTSRLQKSCEDPRSGEVVSLVARNRLVALYRLMNDGARWKPACVFSRGVIRG